jgi:hypothetical protein
MTANDPGPLICKRFAGLLVPIPTLPLPLTKKSDVPAEFCTLRTPTPAVGETTPSWTIMVAVEAVPDPETCRREPGVTVPTPTLPEALM